MFVRISQRIKQVMNTVYNMKKILNPWTGVDGYMCFGCARKSVGVKMDLRMDQEVVSVWKPGINFKDGCTSYGGIQAVLLDEICGWLTLSQCQTVGVTSKMETRYSKPISASLTLSDHTSQVERAETKHLLDEAEIYNPANEICSSVSSAHISHFHPRKPNWK
ncbi:PaaI family thioesterase [Porphyromonadaceae bacterium]